MAIQAQPMQSLNPSRIVARRGRDLMIIGALLLLAGLVACGIGLFVGLLFSNGTVTFLFLLFGGAILLVGLGVMIRGLSVKRDNEPALIVSDQLSRELDSRYTLIRNLSKPNLGYIDAVLVGPPGALVFRLVEKPGIYSNEGSDWLERRDSGFVLSRLDATRDCVTDVHALREYLAKRQLGNVPVYGLVVFTTPEVQLSARQPVVPIAELRTLMTTLRRDFLAADRVDQRTWEQVVKVLYQER
jgi:Nuclease-related domain